MAITKISVRGARQHNLKNISVEIPRNQLTVITGLSGSGKSSLAFDTIYAEGQRRYVESLSAYARQFLEQLEKPDVDSVEGLSPAISIEQKTTSRSPRSTVGTVTEIYDYLRLLFSSIGLPHCHLCGSPIARQSTDQIIHSIRELPHGERVMILAPLVRGRKGEFKKEIENLRTSGFTRARIDGEMLSLDDEIKLDKRKNHTIDVVVDRLMIKDGVGHRLEEAVKIATKLTDGVVIVSVVDGEEKMYSERMACVNCGVSIPQLEPRSFSFNSAFGACKECHGIGSKLEVNPLKLVVDESVPIGKMTFFDNSYLDFYLKEGLLAIARHFKISEDTPFEKLPKKVRDGYFFGLSDTLTFHHGSYKYQSQWKGVKQWLQDQLDRASAEIAKGEDGETPRTQFDDYIASVKCSECQGQRLRPESLAVRVNGLSIAECTALTLIDAAKAFAKLKLNAREEIIAGRILKEIRDRLSFLQAVGLGYLTLDRPSATLSGGEGQRIRLATQIGSQLRGVLYVLDEPSIGLHPRDNQKLLDTLQKLRDIGNTVVVVEHDEDTMRRADYIVDLGPAAGTHGGEVVAVGKPADIEKVEASLTGKYLSGETTIQIPPQRRSPNGKHLTVRDATEHNLKHLDVTFPLGLLTVVTGVSGSGKSTLVEDILYRSIARKLYRSLAEPGAHKTIEGLENIDKIIEIDQSPIGRTPRSNPATYTGLFTPIRELYAMLPESKERGYKPGRFSFNVKGGRCEACQGDGVKRIEMNFLPDVYVTCEVCRGLRYNRETLEVRYQGKNIAQLLNTTIEDALEPLQNHPQIKQKLQTLIDVGLGYVQLGQSATTLSGGEAQRIKLSKELSKRATGRTVYILDEPTTGLHFEDVRKLIDVLQKLVTMGNTVIIIEHNLDVMKSADWIIDLGPEGGEGGGRVVAEGTPEEVAKNKKSFTGQALKAVLNGHLRK
ncbi:MAG: excinuclease ABC subunit UvrA [Acidobacteria bacterium]|nr:excinuclease ABC subunit UvrA [Acidobacteriota bacterium]